MRIVVAPENKTYLNMGCGDTYFEEWTNTDLNPGRCVQRHDLRDPLPFPDGSFDAVYSSHVLEHLGPEDAERLVGHVFTKLKPGGILRLVVPDLELICQMYLDYLDRAEKEPGQDNQRRYRWMQLELLDQMVRSHPGGEMRRAIKSGDFDLELARNRVGDALERDFPTDRPIMTDLRRSDIQGESTRANETVPQKWRRKIRRYLDRWSGRDRDPRATGEVHRWMYDRRSLRQLLESVGFHECAIRKYDESDIPHWDKYNLDVSRYGAFARKPDSLYLEGHRPA